MNGFRFLIFCFLWAFLVNGSGAQWLDSLSKLPGKVPRENQHIIKGSELGYKPGYVVSFRDNFIVTLVNETKFSRINVNYNTSDKVYSLNYKTNDLNTWGLGIDYKWFTFEYTRKMPWYTPDPLFGNVENSGLGFGLTMRRLSFRFFYENYRGYYLENTSDWIKPINPDEPVNYYIRPDISTRMYYTKLNYIFNHKKFSNNASMWQLERQQKWAGTFVAGMSYIYNTFQSDSTLIPVKADTIPTSNNTFFALNSLGINAGFLGTLPFGKKKKWFITGALIPGLSWQYGRLSVEGVGIEKSNSIMGFQSEFRFGFGYNGDLWYIGSVFRSYNNLNNVGSDTPFAITNSFGRFYIGYRFPPIKHNNKWLKRFGL